MADQRSRTALLRGNPLFSSLKEEALLSLVHTAEENRRCYEDGETVYDDSEFQRALGILLSGSVAVYRLGSTAPVLLNVLREGDIFGAAALFGGEEPYVTRITARGRTEILFFPAAAVEELIRSEPDFALAYVTFLSERIRFLNRRIGEFTAGSAEGRLAAYCLRQGGRFTPNMTRLASSLGIGRASLYRILDGLTEAGLLAREGKAIVISDREGLKKLL